MTLQSSKSSKSAAKAPVKAKRAKRAKKDPNKPKGAMSAFMQFSQKERPKVGLFPPFIVDYTRSCLCVQNQFKIKIKSNQIYEESNPFVSPVSIFALHQTRLQIKIKLQSFEALCACFFL